MTAPLQQQLTPGDHQYFEWSTSKQQTNLLHPLMTHTHRRNYYQHSEEDDQLKPTSHIKKKQKLNGITSNDEINHLQVKIFRFKKIKSYRSDFFRLVIHFKLN